MGNESPEAAAARLDERVNGHDQLFEQIANDLKRMAVSYEKLVESNQRVALIERDVSNAKEEVALLWKKFDSLDAARLERDRKRAEEDLETQRKVNADNLKAAQDELKERNRWKRDIAIACVPTIIGLAVYHFLGIHIQ